MATMDKASNPAKTILLGVALVIGGGLFWYGLFGNPFDDLALLRRGRIAPGFIIDSWDDVTDGERGEDIWYHGGEYEYTLPDGRAFSQTTSGSGRLNETFRDLREPYPIQVEYLPDDPEVSRIKGEGSPTVFDWVWRKAGLGSLLLAMFVGPGIVVLRDGFRAMREQKRGGARGFDKETGNRTAQPIA